MSPTRPGRQTADNPAADGEPAADSTTVSESGALAAAASYEHARDELARVVATLEAGGLTLDESISLWEKGEHLARECTRFLDGARQRVETALARAEDDLDPGGNPGTRSGGSSAAGR